MGDFLTDPILVLLTIFFFVDISVGAINRRPLPSAWLSLIGRWSRCAFFSLAIFVFFKHILPQHNLSVLLICSVLIFFLIQTFLYWIQISIFNGSDFADCRRYVECDNAWRPEVELIKLKNRLGELGFRKIGSFKCSHEGFDLVYTTVFESEKDFSRLCVSFVPYGNIWRCCCSVENIFPDDSVLYSEASQIPFGLDYPPNYKVRRFPMISSPIKLLQKHSAILKKSGKTPQAFASSALEFLNGQNFEVEKYNRNEGLINEHQDEEYDGYLSQSGKYAVWSELFKINFFPFLIR